MVERPIDKWAKAGASAASSYVRQDFSVSEELSTLASLEQIYCDPMTLDAPPLADLAASVLLPEGYDRTWRAPLEIVRACLEACKSIAGSLLDAELPMGTLAQGGVETLLPPTTPVALARATVLRAAMFAAQLDAHQNAYEAGELDSESASREAWVWPKALGEALTAWEQHAHALAVACAIDYASGAPQPNAPYGGPHGPTPASQGMRRACRLVMPYLSPMSKKDPRAFAPLSEMERDQSVAPRALVASAETLLAVAACALWARPLETPGGAVEVAAEAQEATPPPTGLVAPLRWHPSEESDAPLDPWFAVGEPPMHDLHRALAAAIKREENATGDLASLVRAAGQLRGVEGALREGPSEGCEGTVAAVATAYALDTLAQNPSDGLPLLLEEILGPYNSEGPEWWAGLGCAVAMHLHRSSKSRDKNEREMIVVTPKERALLLLNEPTSLGAPRGGALLSPFWPALYGGPLVAANLSAIKARAEEVGEAFEEASTSGSPALDPEALASSASGVPFLRPAVVAFPGGWWARLREAFFENPLDFVPATEEEVLLTRVLAGAAMELYPSKDVPGWFKSAGDEGDLKNLIDSKENGLSEKSKDYLWAVACGRIRIPMNEVAEVPNVREYVAKEGGAYESLGREEMKDEDRAGRLLRVVVGGTLLPRWTEFVDPSAAKPL